MSKFNLKAQGSKTVNHAGGQAFEQGPKTELVSVLLTSFVDDQFYRSASGTLDRVQELVNNEVDGKFAAKAAIFARNEFGMRSISHAMAGLIGKKIKGEKWTKNFFKKVVRRPDDVTEIMSFYSNNIGGAYPNSMKKGLSFALIEFDEYQLAKYKAENKDISLVDAVNYLHPVPKEKNKEAFRKLVDGELKQHNTSEDKLTQAGKESKTEREKQEKKSEAWKDLIKEGKIGYMALIKNLRNILEQADNELINDVKEMIVDKDRIRGSLIFPFRLQKAYSAVKAVPGEKTREFIRSLNEAINISVDNVPKFDGKTLVALDTSGSMNGRPWEIGALFSAIILKKNECDFMHFHDIAKYVNYNPDDSVMTLAEMFQKLSSGGTDFRQIFNGASSKYDRIIILSDEQGWVGFNAPTKEFEDYKKRREANPYVYSFDLAGYGSLQLPQQNVYEIAGFSDKVFNIIQTLEQDKQALIHKVEEIVL